MEYIYAAMMLHKAGKPIDEDNIKKILNAAEIKIDSARVKSLVAVLSEIDIDEAIKSASASVAMPAGPATSSPQTETEKPETQKTPEKEEKKEEAIEGLGALFG